MDIGAIRGFDTGAHMASNPAASHAQLLQGATDKSELRKAFDSFVGESFYGQLLSSMRKTQGKPAYFHGGQAEEVFQGQLDQTLAAKMTDANGGALSESMFELFNLHRA